MKTTWLHFGIILIFCLPLKHFGQTVSKKDNPNWTNSADWTLGVPLNGGETIQNVELNNNSNINYDIKIHDTVTINTGKKLITSGKIEISKGGKLIVYGQVIILDETLELKDDGSLIIMDGGYFEGGGKGEFKLNGGGFHLAEGGKLIWDGKFTIDDDKASVKIDGSLVAKELKNEGKIKGNGIIEVSYKLENDGTIFDCTKKQCCASYPCLLGDSKINDKPFLKDYSYNVTDRGLVNLCLEMQDVKDDALILNNIFEKPEKAKIVSIDPGQLCLDFTAATGIQRFLIEVCDNGEPRQCVNVELEFELEININLKVYKGISPNGDGYNDLWIIDGIEQFPDNTIKVFDRWGKLVYSVENYNNEDRIWDGTANVGGGKTLPNGSYFYRIDIEGNEVLKGYVELLK